MIWVDEQCPTIPPEMFNRRTKGMIVASTPRSPVMKLRTPLYDFQKIGAEFAVNRRFSLNGDRMGCGKTAQALSLACAVGAEKTLVLCPSFLRLNWMAEIEKFIGKEALPRFRVVSYDSIYKVADFQPYGFIIADEVHYLKSMGAKRTQAVHTRMAEHPPEYFLGLSGTPIKNNVGEFYSLLKLCHYGGRYPEFDRYSKSQWLFQREFMKEKRMRFGGKKFTKFEGVKNVEVLRDLIKPIYIRRRTEEVLSLPPQIRQEIVVAETSKFDGELEAAWDAYKGGKDMKNFSSAKAVSALAKVPFTTEIAQNILASSGRVIIFTDHVQSARALLAEFPKGQCITGDTPMAERHAIVNLMQAGKLEVLIATIASLSVGVNLTGCSHMVFNDIGFVPGDVDQAEARIHRIGQKETCHYYFILASRMDQKIYRDVRQKRLVITEVGT